MIFEDEIIQDLYIYEVSDPEEVKLLLDALMGDNPVLSDEEVDEMLFGNN